MKLTVKPELKIEDGQHEGVITAVEYREKPYEYTDFVIEFEKGKRIKAGYPTIVTLSSKLGRLFLDFKYNINVGSEVEPEWLIDKHCSFLTITNGKFANVVNGSMKPLE